MEPSETTLRYLLEPTAKELADESNATAPFTVRVHLRTIVRSLEAQVAGHEQYVRDYAPPPGWRPERHRAYLEEKSLLVWLAVEATRNQPYIQWDTSRRDLIRDMVKLAVCNREFSIIRCSICQDSYTPSEIVVEKWAERERHVHGGSQVLCPRRHRLVKALEWMS